METNLKIYGIRKRNEGVYYEDSVVAESWEDAETLAAIKDAELTGEIQEIYSVGPKHENVDQYY